VVAAQGDMELVGVADLVPSISHRALVERGSPYNLYRAFAGKEEALIEAGISASGTLEELNQTADVFFHGYANYENSVNADILKLTSNNTTGIDRYNTLAVSSGWRGKGCDYDCSSSRRSWRYFSWSYQQYHDRSST